MNMERFYSLKSAAEILDISIRTMRRIVKNERIEIYKVGRRIRLSESQLKSMIKLQKPVKDIVDEILNT